MTDQKNPSMPQAVLTAGQFRKKPVVIEAWRIDLDNPPPQWVSDALAKFEGETGAIDWCPSGEGLWINTLEGCMTAAMGDMLIKGVKGELYACKPDIFEATYEPADAALSRMGGEAVPARPLIEALEFYADRDHFHLDPDSDWEDCSGEPRNFLWRDESQDMIEDGSVARAALEGIGLKMTPTQYKAALARVEDLMFIEPSPTSEPGQQLAKLTDEIAGYEAVRYPLTDLAAPTAPAQQAAPEEPALFHLRGHGDVTEEQLVALTTPAGQQAADVQGEALTDERCYDLVKEAGLDWQRGFSADVASGNRYTALCNLARRASAPTADPVRGDAPTIASQIDRMALAHGSLRRLAEVLGLDPGYLSRLRSGEKTEPSEEVLKALGLRKIVAYDLIYKATPLQPRTKSA